MGNLFSCYLCCILCRPKRTIGNQLSEDIILKMYKSLDTAMYVGLPWERDRWYPNISKNKTHTKKLSQKIFTGLNSISDFKPYYIGDLFNYYMSMHISYYLLNKLVNKDHIFGFCSNISANNVRNCCNQLTLSKENSILLQKQIGTFPAKIIQIDSHDIMEIKLLNDRFNGLLDKLIDNLDLDFYDIIHEIYYDYITKANEEEERFKEGLQEKILK